MWGDVWGAKTRYSIQVNDILLVARAFIDKRRLFHNCVDLYEFLVKLKAYCTQWSCVQSDSEQKEKTSGSGRMYTTAYSAEYKYLT